MEVPLLATWWNPDYDGEGLILEEYDNGVYLAYMFTYKGVDWDYRNPDNDRGTGKQLWLQGVGEQQQWKNHIKFTMYETSGGTFGSLYNPDSVNRKHWGRLRLDLIDCNTIEMSITNGNTLGIGSAYYTLQRILPADMMTNSFCEDEGG